MRKVPPPVCRTAYPARWPGSRRRLSVTLDRIVIMQVADDGLRTVELAVLPLHCAHLHGVCGLLLQFCVELADGCAKRLVRLVEHMHPAAGVNTQRVRCVNLAIGLHRPEAGGKRVQRSLCRLNFGAVCTQCVGRGGDDVGGRVEPCGQLLIQGIAAVCGHASGEPVLHRVVLCPELRPAKAEKAGQHHHDAKRRGNSLFAQRGGQGLFEVCQLLLEGRQPHFLLGGRCGAIAGSVKAAGGLILLSGKICVCHFSSGSPSSSVSARLRCG